MSIAKKIDSTMNTAAYGVWIFLFVGVAFSAVQRAEDLLTSSQFYYTEIVRLLLVALVVVWWKSKHFHRWVFLSANIAIILAVGFAGFVGDPIFIILSICMTMIFAIVMFSVWMRQKYHCNFMGTCQ